MSYEYPSYPQSAGDLCPPPTAFNYSWRRHVPSDLSRIHDSSFSIVRVPLEESSPPPPPPPSLRASPLPLESREPWDAPLSFEPIIAEAERRLSSSIPTFRGRDRTSSSNCFPQSPRFPSPPGCPNRVEFGSPPQVSNCVEDDDASTQVDPSSPGNSMYSNTDTVTDTIYYDDFCQEYEPLHRFHRSRTVPSNLCQWKILNDGVYSHTRRDRRILRKPVPSVNFIINPARFSSLRDRRPSSPAVSDLKLHPEYLMESPSPTFSESSLPVQTTAYAARSFFDFSNDDDEPSVPVQRTTTRSDSLQQTISGKGRTRFRRGLSNATTALRNIILCGR